MPFVCLFVCLFVRSFVLKNFTNPGQLLFEPVLSGRTTMDLLNKFTIVGPGRPGNYIMLLVIVRSIN